MKVRKCHHRRSIRLWGYDYPQPGAYFVTICTHNREPLFGQVEDGRMVLNVFGRIVWEEWFRTAQVRPYVELFEVHQPDSESKRRAFEEALAAWNQRVGDTAHG